MIDTLFTGWSKKNTGKKKRFSYFLLKNLFLTLQEGDLIEEKNTIKTQKRMM